jgi:hypothetical protein
MEACMGNIVLIYFFLAGTYCCVVFFARMLIAIFEANFAFACGEKTVSFGYFAKAFVYAWAGHFSGGFAGLVVVSFFDIA